MKKRIMCLAGAGLIFLASATASLSSGRMGGSGHGYMGGHGHGTMDMTRSRLRDGSCGDGSGSTIQNRAHKRNKNQNQASQQTDPLTTESSTESN